MKKILAGGDVFFDVHCHVFNYRDVPDKFLGIRIPQNEHVLSFLEKTLHRIVNHTDTDKFSNLAYFIDFLKTHTSKEVAQKLFEYFPGENMIICPLMMDMEQGIGGKIIDDYLIQIEKIREVRDMYPAQILPFLAIDPNNPRMKENFLKVFSKKNDYNFFGVKVYPSLGYLPTNPLLLEIFEICESKHIPVTAHCSGAIVHNRRKRINNIQGVHQNYDGSWSSDSVSMKFRRKPDYAWFFNQPANWIPVLEKFPKLKLNLAHFGGDDQWEKYCDGDNENWVNRIIDMMQRFDCLYSDFSYTFYNAKYAKALRELLKSNKKIARKVLYGTDYYMVVTEGHFRSLNTGFKTIMGDKLMQKLARENPKKFLFE